jgi:hypothetical protein
VHDKAVLDLYRKLIEVVGGLGLFAKISIFLGIAVVGTAMAMAVVVSLPADHFQRRSGREHWIYRHPVLRWVVLLSKNLLGVLLLPLGVFMVLPGVPGPGLVFILIALSLIDFPGKRAAERWLLARPSVIRFINSVRASFGRPPLSLDPE